MTTAAFLDDRANEVMYAVPEVRYMNRTRSLIVSEQGQTVCIVRSIQARLSQRRGTPANATALGSDAAYTCETHRTPEPTRWGDVTQYARGRSKGRADR